MTMKRAATLRQAGQDAATKAKQSGGRVISMKQVKKLVKDKNSRH
ncbi:hypothetical protein [Lacticaseibacillus camelliae]|nr:hypothetical protein [Lacticaseibacillus camelliae]